MRIATLVRNGDVAAPRSIGPQIIAHLCNEAGVWTGKTSRKIAKQWPASERAFKAWYRLRNGNDFGIGAVQFVNVNRTHVNRVVRVANMVSRRGVRLPIQCRAFRKCLVQVAAKAIRIRATVHIEYLDRIQTDCWQDLQTLIEEHLCAEGIDVFVYKQEESQDDQMFAKVLDPRPRFELVDFRLN